MAEIMYRTLLLLSTTAVVLWLPTGCADGSGQQDAQLGEPSLSETPTQPETGSTVPNVPADTTVDNGTTGLAPEANEAQQQCAALEDKAVQAYIDDTNNLLQGARSPDQDNEIGMLVRARTFMILERLGPSGKQDVMRFLVEAGLVQSVDGKDPIVKLETVNLSGVDLPGINLNGAVLGFANLMGADLSSADLSGAHVYEAQLRRANVQSADLSRAEIPGADLSFTNLSDAVLREANLEGTSMQGTDLSDADLRSAKMLYAVDFGTDLRGADLRGAEGFDLPVAHPTTDSPTLGDTTMPDGSIRDTPNQASEATEEHLSASDMPIEIQQAQCAALQNDAVYDAAVQAYIDDISRLLLEDNLRDSEEGSEVRTLAHERTLDALEGLDPSGKREVMRFLIKADLLQDPKALTHNDLLPQEVEPRPPVIKLSGADLSGVYLSGAEMRCAAARCNGMEGADLVGADLNGADLSGANLRIAHMEYADLRGADLRGANLSDFTTYLNQADLSGTNLEGADLRGTTLYNADLSGANLTNADLRGASGADLEGTRLEDAEGIACASVDGSKTVECEVTDPTPEDKGYDDG